MKADFITVLELNKRIKLTLEDNVYLRDVLVKGEISNLTKHSSGHFYFSLKDANASIKAIMFGAGRNPKYKTLKDGDSILANGSVSFYENRGDAQLYVTNIILDGIGLLYQQYEALKQKLSLLGIFAVEHKKAIPLFPHKIGIITSRTGDAIHDVLTTIKRRYPLVETFVFPTTVQGDLASQDIIKSLLLADKQGFDTLILARGGGSFEDLWCFNDELLIETIYNLKTPLITGVGHDPDYTLVDFVADLRAPTPTGAAERATPYTLKDLNTTLQNYKSTLVNRITNTTDKMETRLNNIKERPLFKQKDYLYRNSALLLDNLINSLAMNAKNFISSNQNKISLLKTHLANNFLYNYRNNLSLIQQLKGKLEAYNPLGVLQRGYSIVENKGKILTSITNVKIDDEIKIVFKDGSAEAKIKGVEHGKN
ncbi:MAG: exodeoxyribonuclease VII large subunit [Bacillales bacterium]|jgi:exodeoxyribonuclease VII large subunit|nr:exodeoxyribonuclease VII large subunit [Bacillales bacterium]